MVRRSFRLGLWAGVLFGLGFALVKTMQARRAASPAPPPRRDAWPPMADTSPTTPSPAATPAPAAKTTPEPVKSPAPAPLPAPASAPSPLHPAEAPRLEVVRDAGAQAGDEADGDSADEEAAVDLAGYLSAAEVEPELHADSSPGRDDADTAAAGEPAAPAPTLHLVPQPAPEPEPEVVGVASDRLPEPAPTAPEPEIASAPEPVTPEVAATPPATRPAGSTKTPAAKKATPAKKAAKKAAKEVDAAGKTWVAPVSPDMCPETHPVKAKLASRLFHLPGMLAYTRTRPDRCYESADAAVADDFTPAKR
jgi:hypothetical protein